MPGTSPAITRELSPQPPHVVMAALVAAMHDVLAALRRGKTPRLALSPQPIPIRIAAQHTAIMPQPPLKRPWLKNTLEHPTLEHDAIKRNRIVPSSH